MRSLISALVAAFRSLFHPKMLGLALWPTLTAAALWLTAALMFWGTWLNGLETVLHAIVPEKWLGNGYSATASRLLLDAVLIVLLISASYLTALVITAIFAMPAMVDHIARSYYPGLERKKGGNATDSMMNTVTGIAIYLLLLVLSLPLWLIFPLSVILPALLMAYLNQRLFRYDALAEHASKEEIARLAGHSSVRYFLLGAVAGLLQFVPLLNLFLPLFTGLAFAHFCLGELQKLRAA